MGLRFRRGALALLVTSPAFVAAAVAATSCGGQTGGTAPGVDAATDGSHADQHASDSAVNGTDGNAHADTGGSGPDGGVSDGAPDAPQDVAFDNDPGCPVAYGAMSGCGPSGLVCRYPQGQCNCMVPCSGVAQLPDASVWMCTMNAGCPQDPPSAGSACAQAGQHCVYPGCCTQDDFTCSGGAWDAAPPFCPP